MSWMKRFFNPNCFLSEASLYSLKRSRLVAAFFSKYKKRATGGAKRKHSMKGESLRDCRRPTLRLRARRRKGTHGRRGGVRKGVRRGKEDLPRKSSHPSWGLLPSMDAPSSESGGPPICSFSLSQRGKREKGERRCGTTLGRACSRGGPGGASCVRRLDGSPDPAIRITYRVSLRSSSSREPRYPSTGVVGVCLRCLFWVAPRGGSGETPGSTSRGVVCHEIEQREPLPGRPRPSRGRLSSPKGVFSSLRRPSGAGPARERTVPPELPRAGWSSPSRSLPPQEGEGGRGGESESMILPQVHLRKPCYDFSFL